MPTTSWNDRLCAALIATMTEAVLVLDDKDVVQLASERAARMFGYADAGELRGRRRDQLLDDLEPRTCGPQGVREGIARRADGGELPVEVAEGEVDGEGGCLLVIHDLSRRRRLEYEHRAIFEATGDGMVVYAQDGTIIDANPAFCEMNGYSCGELVGRNVRMLVDPRFHDLLQQFIDTVITGGSLQARATNVRKDGSTFPVHVHGAVIYEEDRPVILGVARDVTEQVQAYDLLERRVEERTRELETLLGVAQDVASVLELEPLLHMILKQIKAVTDYDLAAVLKFEQHDVVLLAGAFGDAAATGPWAYPFSSMGPAWVWDILRSGETILIDDVRGEEPLARAYREVIAAHPEMAIAPGEASWMAVPLIVREQTVGAITFLHGRTGYYTQHHARLARAIAQQAAIAIENARLYEQAQESAALEERQRLARELHDAVTQTLFSASLMAEMIPTLWARDPEAGMQRLEDVRALTRGALAEMRTLLLELRPARILETDLAALLGQLGEILAGRSRLPVDLTLEGDGELPPEVRLAFYRIAQEALHNIDKHARATHVAVRLTVEDAGAELVIEDDGRGFAIGNEGTDGFAHFGMTSMRERAESIGARLRVDSAPGQGTRVCVSSGSIEQGSET